MTQLVPGTALLVQLPAARRRIQTEGAAPLHKTHHRLAKLAESRGAQTGRAARFVVKQDGREHRLHVATHAVTVVVEDRRHTRHIGRAGVAGHQPLDHLLAKERTDVGMVEERVECGFQRCRAVRIGGNGHAQKGRCQRAVPVGVQHHAACGHRGVGNVAAVDDRDAALADVQIPPGQNARQIGHVGLRVAGQLAAVGGAFFSAVEVQLVQADREQLHHFAGVVFVRLAALRVFFLVAAGIEENAHGRREGDLFKQLAEVTARALHQKIPVLRHAVTAPFQLDAVERDHKKL